MTPPASALLVEFVCLFVLLPLAYRFSPVQLPPLPLLWLAALYCWLMLRRDTSFSAAQLWNPAVLPSQLPNILAIAAVFAILLFAGVYLGASQLFLDLPKHRPVLWAVVMVFYPIVSVYPQSLIYRAFLLHRYAPLLTRTALDAGTQRWTLIILSAAAFGFMHIIFRNPLAVSLTFAGGLLFAWRYQATQSLFTSAFEHALYGCLLFTVGLGRYFYHGTVFGQTPPLTR